MKFKVHFSFTEMQGHLNCGRFDEAMKVYQMACDDPEIETRPDVFRYIGIRPFIQNGRLNRHPMMYTILNLEKGYINDTRWFTGLTSIDDILEIDSQIDTPLGAVYCLMNNREKDFLEIMSKYNTNKINRFFHQYSTYMISTQFCYYHLIRDLYIQYDDVMTLTPLNRSNMLNHFLQHLAVFVPIEKETDAVVKELIEFLISETELVYPEGNVYRYGYISQALHFGKFKMAELLFDYQFTVDRDICYTELMKSLKNPTKIISIRKIDPTHPVWFAICERNYKRFEALLKNRLAEPAR